MIICHPDPPPNAQLFLHSLLAVIGEFVQKAAESEFLLNAFAQPFYDLPSNPSFKRRAWNPPLEDHCV